MLVNWFPSFVLLFCSSMELCAACMLSMQLYGLYCVSVMYTTFCAFSTGLEPSYFWVNLQTVVVYNKINFTTELQPIPVDPHPSVKDLEFWIEITYLKFKCVCLCLVQPYVSTHYNKWMNGCFVFIGMLEKACFVAEFESVHATGVSGMSRTYYYAAEHFSCIGEIYFC